MPDPDKKEQALRFLADPTNWIGDPMTLDAELTGHFTPFELACNALADEDDFDVADAEGLSAYGPEDK